MGGLIQTMKFLGKEDVLHIYGPKGVEQYTNFFTDWDHYKTGYEIKIHPIDSGTLHESEDYSIEAFPVEHSCESYGFIFKEKPSVNLDKEKIKELGLFNSPKCRELKEKGRIRHGGKDIKLEDVITPKKKGKKIVYSGDTAQCDSLKEAAEGADLLIVDSTFGEDNKKKAHQYMHGEAGEMAKLAKESEVKKLVLTHFSNRYNDESILEKEAKRFFKDTVAAKDLMKIKV